MFFVLLRIPSLCIFSYLTNFTFALKCYDCTYCPYPWSTFGIQTYGSFVGIFSRVKSCYKKEFYNAIDRRLDRVVRGALDRECKEGKLETNHEKSITYCCYSNYCNGALSRELINYILMNAIALLSLILFTVKE
ncbi:unnamed protein product [Rotaria sp. Silwood1]|nr:unnamed protein product [Rotaria sp. Silwood1]CAF3350873.1 unnamed protein product [Rotaria sp. Silwood1]CAF3373880.1 unnamed protein product [Rotaria sp. Silwood1]CAF4748767.1 unnamed protein product [Rotaria sp. Silwood1]